MLQTLDVYESMHRLFMLMAIWLSLRMDVLQTLNVCESMHRLFMLMEVW